MPSQPSRMLSFLAVAACLASAGGCGGAFSPRSSPPASSEDAALTPGATAKAAPAKEDPMPEKVERTEAEWKAALTPEQYRVLREKGTERAYTGAYWDTKTPGVYRCAGCATELFRSDAKFDSHCGWPAFDREFAKGRIVETLDTSHGMVRTEVTCARCGGHLGHLFDDGPTDTGMRYCINSASIDLTPEPGARGDERGDTGGSRDAPKK